MPVCFRISFNLGGAVVLQHARDSLLLGPMTIDYIEEPASQGHIEKIGPSKFTSATLLVLLGSKLWLSTEIVAAFRQIVSPLQHLHSRASLMWQSKVGIRHRIPTYDLICASGPNAKRN